MIYNPYLVVPAATWAITQLAKFTIAAIKGKIDFRNLYASGGMPSVHSAVVCSLAVTALVVDGPGSNLFGFTAIFAVITMYDSFGVRRSSGEQAVALNQLIASSNSAKAVGIRPALRVREILGHTPSEVIIGALTGSVLALLFNYERITPLTNYLATVPRGPELISYAVIGGVILLGGVVASILLRSRKSPVLTKFARQLGVATTTIGIVLLILAVSANERAAGLSWRAWPLLALAAMVVWATVLFRKYFREVPPVRLAELESERKGKWLPQGKPKKKARAR